MQKKLVSLALALTLLLALSVPALAADGVQTGSIAGGKAVYVSMAGRTGDIALANGSVVAEAAAGGMVSGAVAAINGGFFNSYSHGSTFPSNCPQIYGVVTKNGEVVNANGLNNAAGFTYDGKVLIDRVDVGVVAAVARPDGSAKANITLWGVNRVFDDDAAIVLLTPMLTLPYTAKADATVYTLQNDKVTKVQTGGTLTAAAGTKLLVLGKAALADLQKWQHQPEVGDTVKIANTYAPTRTADQESWKNVKTVAAGGRMLVQNGVNVTADASYNKEFDAKADQTNASSSSRSYVAVLKDGRCVFGTASGTFPAIADALVAAGAVNAVSMDGGASCFLYADGATLTPAGRQLASVLQIVPANSAETKPEQVQLQTPVDTSKNPSSWAEAPLKEGRALGLIPDWLDAGYRDPITRSDFCTLLGKLLPAATGQTLDQLRQSTTSVEVLPWDETGFTDLGGSDYFIRSCAALRIVNGKGAGTFQPNAPITRQEAASMMQRAGAVLGITPAKAPQTFADAASIASWARESVDFVTACGIMNGTGSGFNPTGTYTREQAFITMLNAYHAAVG